MIDNHDDEILNLVFQELFSITLPALNRRTLPSYISEKRAVTWSQAFDALALRRIIIRGFLR
jgi:hypothetical protein